MNEISNQEKNIDFLAKWSSCPHAIKCDVLGSSNKSLMCKLLKYRLEMII